MEVLGVFAIAAVIGGLFWFFVVRDKDDKSADQPPADDTPTQPVPTPGPIQDPLEPGLRPPSADFSVENLEKLTKVELEELGKQHGVRLKRGQNKSAMISTLRDGVRTQLK